MRGRPDRNKLKQNKKQQRHERFSEDTTAFCFCSFGGVDIWKAKIWGSEWWKWNEEWGDWKKCDWDKYCWVFQEADIGGSLLEKLRQALRDLKFFLTCIFSRSRRILVCLFPFLSHLNNAIRKHASSNDAFKSAAGKTYISRSAERLILCMLIQKILCGFISTNPSLRLYISVIPTSERSPTAGRTAARGGLRG